MANNIFERLNNGALFEVALLGGNGFGYIKYQLFHIVENEQPFTVPVFRILNYFSKEPIGKDISFLADIDYTFVPLLLLGTPRVRGKFALKHKGDLALKESDHIVPTFSFTMKYGALVGYQGSIKDVTWSKITKLSMLKDSVVPATLEEVKGLGFYTFTASILFNIRLTFFWNKRLNLGLDIEQLIKDESLFEIIELRFWNALLNIEIPE